MKHLVVEETPAVRLTARPLGACGTVIIGIAGRLDLAAASGLREFLLRLLREPRAGADLVVDLSEVAHLDPAGLAAFVGMWRRVHRAGGSLRLAAAGPQVRERLTTTGVARMMPVYPTVQAAAAESSPSWEATPTANTVRKPSGVNS